MTPASYVMLGMALIATIFVFAQDETNLTATDNGQSITIHSSTGDDVAILCGSAPSSSDRLGFICPDQVERLESRGTASFPTDPSTDGDYRLERTVSTGIDAVDAWVVADPTDLNWEYGGTALSGPIDTINLVADSPASIVGASTSGTATFTVSVDPLITFEANGTAEHDAPKVNFLDGTNIDITLDTSSNTVATYTVAAPDARDATEFQNVEVSATAPSEEGQYYAYDGTDSFDLTSLVFPFESGSETTLTSAALEVTAGDGIEVTRSGDSNKATYTVASSHDFPCRIKLDGSNNPTRLFTWQSTSNATTTPPWDKYTRATLEHTCEQVFRLTEVEDPVTSVATASYAYVAQPQDRADLLGFVVTIDEQEFQRNTSLANSNTNPPGTATGSFHDVVPVASAASPFGSSWVNPTFTKLTSTTTIGGVVFELWRSTAFTLDDIKVLVTAWR